MTSQNEEVHEAVPVKMTMRAALVKAASGAVDALTLRLDAWQNGLTGFGTHRDKTTHGSYQPFIRLSDLELSAMYHGEDMAARVVDIVPDEMLREGFSIDLGEPELNTALSEKFKALNVQEQFADGIRWARLYGGGAILVGCDDGQTPDNPLRPERAKDITYLYVIERRVLWPVTYYSEPGHPKLGQPKTYMVTPIVAGGTVSSAPTIVHESRLILFRGAKTGAFEKLSLAGWDCSVLQRPYEILRQFNTGWKAVETLLTDGNQAVFRMTGLSEMIGSNQQTALQKRLTLMEMYRSVMRALVIDADSDESYERTTVSFEGIHQVLDKLCIRLAAAAEMPVTILMGQSPSGMNATGDADFRWFFNRIRAKQTTELAPLLRHLVLIWLQTKASPIRLAKAGGPPAAEGTGKTIKPEAITITFPPLWKETPMDEATRRKLVSDTDLNYFTMQALLPEEIAESRFRPEGFGEEIQLGDDSRKAREQLLKTDLKKLAAGEIAPVAPTGPPGAGQPKGAPPGGPPKKAPPA